MAETLGQLVGKALRTFVRWLLIGLGLGLGLKASGLL